MKWFAYGLLLTGFAVAANGGFGLPARDWPDEATALAFQLCENAEIALPDGKPPVRETRVTLGVRKDGLLFVPHGWFSTARMNANLRALAAAKQPCMVEIGADRRTPFGELMPLLEQCRFDGIRNLALVATEKRLIRIETPTSGLDLWHARKTPGLAVGRDGALSMGDEPLTGVELVRRFDAIADGKRLVVLDVDARTAVAHVAPLLDLAAEREIAVHFRCPGTSTRTCTAHGSTLWWSAGLPAGASGEDVREAVGWARARQRKRLLVWSRELHVRRAALLDTLKRLEGDLDDRTSPAGGELPAVSHPTPWRDERAEAATLAELCGMLETVHAGLRQVYTRIRVLALARCRDISLDDAVAGTPLATRALSLADRACAPEPATGEGFNAWVRAMDELAVDYERAIHAERRMVDVARKLVEEPDAVGWENGAEGYAWKDGNGFEHHWPIGYERSTDHASLAELSPPVPGRTFFVNPGRVPAILYLDAWHVIGPFPNPDRQQLDRKFAPESVVDVDEQYVGRNGKVLRWQFVASPTVCIMPPEPGDHSIYYAWTEFRCEETMSALFLFGADDYGKIWIDGKLVWASGKTPHPWIPDRGRCELDLEAGVHRVLVKLENAWGRTGFSVVAILPPAQGGAQ